MSALQYFMTHLDSCKNKGCRPNESSKFGELTKRRRKYSNYDLKLMCKPNVLSNEENIILKDFSKILEEDGIRDSTIKINSFRLEHNRILSTFTRPSVTKSVFQEILHAKESYGRTQVFENRKLKIECEDCGELISYRMKKACQVISALVLAGGGSVTDEEDVAADVETVRLSYRHKSDNTILVGPVSTSRGGQVSLQELIELRTQDMRLMSEHKVVDSESISHLVQAALTFDMICVKLENRLTLELSDEPKASRQTNSKGAPFVLYNYTRLSAILEKHDYFVTKQVYPPLPPLEDINYDLLNSEDEWTLIYDFLAEWPVVVKECQDLSQPKLFRITSFLSALSSTFSVYYRHTRILNEGLPHMVPQMQARIFLLLAIKQVIFNALSLLHITTLTSM